jgi:hypothetical protein
MSKKKFSTLLLTGKAATLPLLMQQAQASVNLSYTDILSSQVTQIELPVTGQVSLDVMGNAAATSTYGGNTDGAATLCSDTAVTNQMTLVVTGLKNGDQVFVATAASSGGNESIDARVKVGSNKLQLPVSTVATAPNNGTVAMSLPLDLTALKTAGYAMTVGSKFYVQTFVFPSGSYANGSFDWTKARVSEMDVITVGSCNAGTYGSYGSTY